MRAGRRLFWGEMAFVVLSATPILVAHCCWIIFFGLLWERFLCFRSFLRAACGDKMLRTSWRACRWLLQCCLSCIALLVCTAQYVPVSSSGGVMPSASVLGCPLVGVRMSRSACSPCHVSTLLCQLSTLRALVCLHRYMLVVYMFFSTCHRVICRLTIQLSMLTDAMTAVLCVRVQVLVSLGH